MLPNKENTKLWNIGNLHNNLIQRNMLKLTMPVTSQLLLPIIVNSALLLVFGNACDWQLGDTA